MSKLVAKIVLSFTIMLFISSVISATPITGSLWQNQPTAAGDATLAQAASLGLPDAMFTTTNFNYNSDTTGYSPALFLNNPTFFDTSGTFDPTADLDNTYFYFVGQTYLQAGSNSLSITHDDGLQLNFDAFGLVVDAPGPTAAVTTLFTITAPSAGFYSFEMSYGECCGPPAVLEFTVNGAPVGANPVPEPATLLLLGSGLLGLTGFRFRRKAK